MDNSRNPFLSLSLSLSLLSSSHPVQKLTLSILLAHRADLNMQNDFFLRHRGSFPCLVHRAHIITGWQENNGQKTIDEKRSGEVQEQERKEKNWKRKKGDIAIRLVTGVLSHSVAKGVVCRHCKLRIMLVRHYDCGG